MRKIPNSNKIYVSKSKIISAGRGVYATKSIKKGEVIERAPYIEIEFDETLNSVSQTLLSYVFFIEKNKTAFVLGCGSLYNHSKNPNAGYEIDKKEKAVIFTALGNINKNEEVNINYRGSKNKSEKIPLWFE